MSSQCFRPNLVCSTWSECGMSLFAITAVNLYTVLLLEWQLIMKFIFLCFFCVASPNKDSESHPFWSLGNNSQPLELNVNILRPWIQVHAGFAGFTGITVGLANNHYVLLPIQEVIADARNVDPNSRMWHRCLTSTGQPDFLWRRREQKKFTFLHTLLCPFCGNPDTWYQKKLI
jgi:hypothetical protein